MISDSLNLEILRTEVTKLKSEAVQLEKQINVNNLSIIKLQEAILRMQIKVTQCSASPTCTF